MPASDHSDETYRLVNSFGQRFPIKRSLSSSDSLLYVNSPVLSQKAASTIDGDVDSLTEAAEFSSDSSGPSTSSHLSTLEKKSVCSPLLVLERGNTTYSIPVPHDLFHLACHLKLQFFNGSIRSSADAEHEEEEEEAVIEQHSSTALLVAQWLEFLVSSGVDKPIRRLLRLTLGAFEKDFLGVDDIHVFASQAHLSHKRKQQLLMSYFAARNAAEQPCHGHGPRSALLHAAAQGSARIYAVFGGQGSTVDYFEELRSLQSIHSTLIANFVEVCSLHLLYLSKSKDPAAKAQLRQGLDVTRWLRHPESTPDTAYLTTAAVSFPLIGLCQMAQYAVTCGIMQLTPGQFRDSLRGVTGHSQGLVVAAVIAASSSWDEFYQHTKIALETLFWTGLRCQEAAPMYTLGASIVSDSGRHNEGAPSPMLTIRGLTLSQVQGQMDTHNAQLPVKQRVEMALLNGPRQFVVAGPPKSLYGLNVRLRSLKAPPDLDQTRIPFSRRKLAFSTRFLPMNVPFHSSHVSSAVRAILDDLRGLELRSDQVAIPLYDTLEGEDVRLLDGEDDILPVIVRRVAIDPVHWEKASLFCDATHIIDFGPGGLSGIGSITASNKDGVGARVILAGVLEGKASHLGYQPELFSLDKASLTYNECWAEKYAPTLVKTSAGQTFVSTKLSRLLSLPPIMVPGMTPTTVHWDVVVAAMNAGYHIELAAGGYHNEEALGAVLGKIAKMAPTGRAITLNVLYVNQKALTWQLQLIKKLRATKGINIEGLTIGAGIPSLSIAKEYIETLGLRHISFKPGCADAIRKVVEIADSFPHFPVILQWTGGRGGGHHSCEDFHEPILATYGQIRQRSNIVLVAGSGFGGAQDTYPYLSGQWSCELGYPAMPFDGVLFGSRMMVAKEAHTSPAAKQAIVNAPGVTANQWEATYQSKNGSGGGGGVLTVVSEMGQPIHKLATRGVQLWSELDRTVFSLPKEQRLAVLLKDRDHIIRGLNTDFQKVWFGVGQDGRPADLHEMTYAQVARRLLDLLYIKSQSRWIHSSYQTLMINFLQCIEERERCADVSSSDSPRQLCKVSNDHDVAAFLAQYPDAEGRLMTARDCQRFLALCMTPGQKPVPFIPALNDDFETFFKKDSLWQSEDIAAVMGEDIGRTCILHGPVAAQFCTSADEPMAGILDTINEGLIDLVSKGFGYDGKDSVAEIGYLCEEGAATRQPNLFPGVMVTATKAGVTYHVPQESPLYSPIDHDKWLAGLAVPAGSWVHAMLRTTSIVQGNKVQASIIRHLLAPLPGIKVHIDSPLKVERTEVRVEYPDHGQILRMRLVDPARQEILVSLLNPYSACDKAVALEFKYTFHADAGYAPIREIVFERIRTEAINQFYWQVWLGDTAPDFDVDMDVDTLLNHTFHGEDLKISSSQINQFCQVIGNHSAALHQDGVTNAPLDLAMVVGWKALVKPLFVRILDGDLLKLVHLSNSFRELGLPLKEGDEVQSRSQVTRVLNQSSGKLVEVRCTVSHANGDAAVEMTSQFLFRGVYEDFCNTFEVDVEPLLVISVPNARALAILHSRKWICFLQPDDYSVVGKDLTFHLETIRRPSPDGKSQNVTISGMVRIQGQGLAVRPVAAVKWHGEQGHVAGSPVQSYLQRHGHLVEQRSELESPIVLSSAAQDMTLTMPPSNLNYAAVSGDFNPIHTVETFASCAGFDVPITHGMYTSAVTRTLVESLLPQSARMRSYHASFVGVVRAGDRLTVRSTHIAMLEGRKILKIEVVNAASAETVLVGEAQVEQARSAYVFTGQGSQEKGMGMDLYGSSAPAKDVWDRADKYFIDTYGFSIIKIVKDNPKDLTVFFGGRRGRKVRNNYLAMHISTPATDPATSGPLCSLNTSNVKMFPDIHEDTPSYTFRCPKGLLHATQFTQPAITLVNMARFQDMKFRGLIQQGSSFAGHSLGEYSALATLAGLMSVEELMPICFFRGMAMRNSVEYDERGRSEYSMCAVNPSKVGGGFTESGLRIVVAAVSRTSGWLLEIVNHNVEDLQYVCAGTLRALHCLSTVLEHIRSNRLAGSVTATTAPGMVASFISASSALNSRAVELTKTATSTPLHSIDVPFHSSYLRPGVDTYRQFLRANLKRESVKPERLVDRWIPNVTGRPFNISRKEFEHVYKLTESAALKRILDEWREGETDE